MENSQSVQQQSSQVEASKSKSENSKSQQRSGWNRLIHLLAYNPWLFLTGLLAIFLGSATLSLYSLGYVGSIKQTKPEEQEAQEVEVVQPINTQSETTNPTPLWMVAAIALSCAGGCLIIFRLLNRPTYQKVQKQKNRYQARTAQRHHQNLESLPPKNSAVLLPPQPQTPVMATSDKTKPVVTVLPQEPSSSRGKSKESLASTLDIRKQTSLAAILRKN